MDIVVRFLVDRYVARRSDLTARSEWPPSPDRLFQALTNSAHHLPTGANVKEARLWLTWLEACKPPTISAAYAEETIGKFKRYDVRSVLTRQQRDGRSVKLINPRQDEIDLVDTPLSDPVVIFRYDEQLPPEFTAIARSTAAGVGYLGASESHVVLTIGDAPARSVHVQYKPDSEGELILGLPYVGRLADLDAAIDAFRRPDRKVWEPIARVRPRPVRYSIASDNQGVTEALGDFDSMVALAFKADGQSVPLIDSLRFPEFVNGARRAFLSKLPRGAHGLLTGHDHRLGDGMNAAWPGAHAAFVPLFDVGFRYAGSRLRGIGLVLPREIDAVLRREALRAFNLNHLVVHGRVYQLEHRAVGEGELEALRIGRYAAWSRKWTTATPIRLWRMPDRNGRDIPELVAEAIRQAGYPAPLSVETSPSPFIEGGRHAGSFRNVFEKPYWLVHARFAFATEVRGPMLVGRGRHAGFGLCVVERHDRERVA